MNEIFLRLFQPYTLAPVAYEFDGEDYYAALKNAMSQLFNAEPASAAWESELTLNGETEFTQADTEDCITVELSAPDYYYISFPDMEEEV